MIIGIIGSRKRDTYVDYDIIEVTFFNHYKQGDSIVSGGCPQGGDHFAEIIADRFNIPIIIHYPDWDKYGKQAGFIRNTYIAEDADILIACVSEDRKGGTEDTITKFKKLKLKGQVILV